MTAAELHPAPQFRAGEPLATGTARAQPSEHVAAQAAARGARDRESRAFLVVTPRLLSVEDAAGYLGVNPDIIKGWLESGTLTAVKVPRPRTLREHKRGATASTIRRTLIDVRDLDALVERWKARDV